MIKVNPDSELVASVKKSLKENEGHCPCILSKTPESKCMCKEFRDMEEGVCHCGLYIKIKR